MASQGQQLLSGRYELHRRIARGGMADVYLARDSLLDRPVAVKVLFSEFATDPSFVQRFRREAQAAANLSHPNVVSVFDWGEQDGTYYIVMEYVQGRSLAQVIHDEGPLLPDRAADIAADIAAALAFAHRNGVVHRDVKPGNVLLDPSGHVKVTDFGIARAVSSRENLTQTGTVMGTATYFSPEQAQGHNVDPRSDVYSLGIVLYEMLTGRPPFTGDSPVTVAYKHVQETPTPPRQRNGDVPAPLEAIAMKALAKNPANRYASAEDLRGDLRRFREGRPILAEPLLAAPFADEPTRAGEAVTGGRTRVQAAYGDGTSVLRTTEQEERRQAPARSRSGPFVAALVVLLLLLAGLLFLLARSLGLLGVEQVTVPNVVNQTQEQAEATLRAEGFDVAVESVTNDTVAEGIVFEQDPAAGGQVDEGSEVLLRVSAGPAPVRVPDVVGRPLGDAQAALEEAGLRVEAQRQPSADAPVDEVVSQDPPADEEVARGTTVRLVVSSGPPTVEVPDVRGRSESAAANALGQAGFSTTSRREPSDSVPAGQVIRTEPEAGADVQPGSEVVIVVSDGPVTVEVPDVDGLTEQQAVRALEDAGLAVEVFDEAVSDRGDDGRVVEQQPSPGTERPRGATVRITIGRFTGGGGGGGGTTTTTTTTTGG